MSYWPLHPAYSRQPIYALPGEVSSQSVAFWFVFDCYQQTFLTPISWHPGLSSNVASQWSLIQPPSFPVTRSRGFHSISFIVYGSCCNFLVYLCVVCLPIHTVSSSETRALFTVASSDQYLAHKSAQPISVGWRNEWIKKPNPVACRVPSTGDKGIETQRLDLGTLLV